ncbi:hypothetical protein BD408DRAFT_407299 [Parasitella parasitica]|nr:hypothetical protein BD408DRAFT_407299 [Parasitella parasitica]
MDRLPKDFSSTVISAATSLEIPLTSSVVLSVSPNVQLTASYANKLPASIAYTFDSTADHCLRPKTSLEICSTTPNFAKKFLKLVKQNHLKLAPFFVRAFIHHRRFAGLGRFPFSPLEDHRIILDVSPFVQAIFSSLSPTSRSRQHLLSTKSYRKLYLPPLTPPPPLPRAYLDD